MLEHTCVPTFPMRVPTGLYPSPYFHSFPSAIAPLLLTPSLDLSTPTMFISNDCTSPLVMKTNWILPISRLVFTIRSSSHTLYVQFFMSWQMQDVIFIIYSTNLLKFSPLNWHLQNFMPSNSGMSLDLHTYTSLTPLKTDRNQSSFEYQGNHCYCS